MGVGVGGVMMREDAAFAHTARHSTAAAHFCHVLVQSDLQRHNSFISDTAAILDPAQAVWFP